MTQPLRLLIALLTGLLLLTTGCLEPDESACSSDAECKGDRICEAGACTSLSTPQDNPPVGPDPDASPGEFGASCTQSSQCNRGPCIFRGNAANGFCTKNCDAISECPANYDCTVIGNASRKSCVPEDRLSDCEGACREYSFFMCLADGAEAACLQGCQDATVSDRLTFSKCGDPLMCTGQSCFEALAPGKGPWLKDESAGCMRTQTGLCSSSDKEYACPDGSTPPEDPMFPNSCQFQGTDPASQADFYCCIVF